MRSFSCFKPRDPFRIWSKELDKRVAIWAKDFDSSFKLLLLGPAGAGKTTILKQMKIIHSEGFTLEERQQKAMEIRANLLESVRELIACIRTSGHEINWSDEKNQGRLEFIQGLILDDQTYDLYAAKIYDYSKRILTDRGVEELFAKLNQLSITHRSQYLLNRVDEIRSANYVPNNDDILQSRRRTSDIQKLEFQVDLPIKSGQTLQQTFCMFDVGGQRGERRKWIQVFDGVSAVMFLIDSSSFDAVDDENGRNKLKETLNLFYEVWTTRFLLNSNFVLLFNKQDILREKITRGHRIEDHFPEYKHYKFQPSERASGGNRSSTSDKLNPFRGSMGRSSRGSSSRAASSPMATQIGDGMGTVRLSGTVGSVMGMPGDKRKSSIYRLSGDADEATNNSKQSSKQSSNKQSTTKNSHSLFSIRRSSSKSSSLSKEKSNPTTSISSSHSAHPTLANISNNKPTPLTETDINSSMAQDQDYLRARSFIRDKFLQITRQLDRDQRKYSVPNIMYSSPGCVDQPKRNVCYHYTTATDTENIRELFENLQKLVAKSTMKDFR